MAEWQPIETAPYDQWVLVFGEKMYSDDRERHVMGVAKRVRETHEWWESVSRTRRELQSEEKDAWLGAEIYATHWMPLPDAPA